MGALYSITNLSLYIRFLHFILLYSLFIFSVRESVIKCSQIFRFI